MLTGLLRSGVLVLPAAPDVSAEHPERRGVEQEPWDEDQQIEIGVHLLNTLFPVGQVVATWRGGVGHRPRPLVIPNYSHLDELRYPKYLEETQNT